MLQQLFSDLLYAARRLSAAPAFAAAAVVTIALGVGINTGIFSVLNGLAFRELPAVDAAELVSIYQTNDDATRQVRSVWGSASLFSTSEYRTYRDGARTLSGLLGHSSPLTATLGGDTPQEVRGTLVTCNFFEVLRQPPALGPGFAPDCDAEGAPPAVVLGHELWTTAFDADPAIVGREILLNRKSFVVAGIAPAGARGIDFEPVQLFATITTQPLLNPLFDASRGEWSWLALVGRAAAGENLTRIRAELRVIANRIDQAAPPRRTVLSIDRARPFADPLERTEVVAAGAVVMTAFGLVLLLACANVANLLLARAMARTREIAVRLSLGASRGRIVRQLLAESLVLAGVGGLLGTALATWTTQGLVRLAIASLPPQAPSMAIDASPNGSVLAFALAATLLSGIAFGLVPALQASKPDLQGAMKGDVAGVGRSGARLQGTLVGVQVALCMVLAIAAGLLLRGLQATESLDPGFEYEDVAVASFNLTTAGYNARRAAAFQQQLIERVAALPGVEAVAQVGTTPLSPGNNTLPARLGGPDQWFPLQFNTVSGNYFALTAMPLVRGRTFTSAELADGGAVIVTEATARRFWPGRDPLGERLELALSNPAITPVQTLSVSVVGVTKDAQITGVGELTERYAYFPAVPERQTTLSLLAKSGDFASTARGIGAAVAELDADLVVNIAPLEENLELYRGIAGLASTLATALGVLALALATVGVYAVVACTVGRRVREIGIRMALGANARSVVALMLKRSLRPVVIGAVIGVAAAVGVSRILSSALFGVSPVDPIALLGSAAVVAAIALTAATLPARRAARIEPTRTLQHE